MSRRKRRRHRRARRHAPGTAPGSLHRHEDAGETVVRVIAYGPDDVVDMDLRSVDQVRDLLSRFPVVWIDVHGLGNVELIEKIGAQFKLHPLALEDVTHLHQRAKVEDYGDNLFVVARMADSTGEDVTEQLAMFLGEGFVITFQERPGDPFDPVRERVRTARPNLRAGGADYLLYALLDAVIDGYFPALEGYGDRLEGLEDRILDEPSTELMAEIQEVKRELLQLRRALWPHREMINGLIRDERDSLSERTVTYLRDCYDHVIQAVDLLESHRELAAGLVDLYLSSVSNRLNEVMKVLTIIATIFIPLGFIAGLYGMNFNPAASPWNMPELNWTFGYPMALGVMAAVAVAMLAYFRRKGWL